LFHELVKPTPVTFPPGAMLPLNAAFVTVTFAPLCVSVPFQSWRGLSAIRTFR